MTSTVLPVLEAQAAVASLTAAVSASPELPIITVSFTGPFLVFWVAELLLKPPPPPQALSASMVVVVAATTRTGIRLIAAPQWWVCRPAWWWTTVGRSGSGGASRGASAGGLHRVGMPRGRPGLAGARGARAHREGGGEQGGEAEVGALLVHDPPGLGRCLAQRLAQARQLEGLRDVAVVEADDADVAARLEAAVADGAQCAEGEDVRGADDRGVCREPGEQPVGGGGRDRELLHRLLGDGGVRETGGGKA